MDDLLSEFLTETNENLATLDVELVASASFARAITTASEAALRPTCGNEPSRIFLRCPRIW